MKESWRASSVWVIPAVKQSRLAAEFKHPFLPIPQGMLFAVTCLAEHLQIIHIFNAYPLISPMMDVQPLRGMAPFTLIVRAL